MELWVLKGPGVTGTDRGVRDFSTASWLVWLLRGGGGSGSQGPKAMLCLTGGQGVMRQHYF